VSADSLESDRLEFKQEDPSVKRTLEILADAVVCLANADVGHIVLGVTDVSGPQGSLQGLSSAITPDLVVRDIFDRTRPSLSVPMQERVEDGVRLLVITTPRGATFCANTNGTATRRVGKQCQPFPPDQQKQALASAGLFD
jgi:ATP-dependent DNA helicase RecG